MPVPVLPRDVAGRVITSAVSAMGAVVSVGVLVTAIPVLVETLLGHGAAAVDLVLPILMLVVVLAALIAALVLARTWASIAYLALGAVATVVYELAVLGVDPTLIDSGVYLVNRPALALVVISFTATTTASGILWCLAGWATTMALTGVVSLIAGCRVPARARPHDRAGRRDPRLSHAGQHPDLAPSPGAGLRRARSGDAQDGERRGPRAAFGGRHPRHRAQRPRAHHERPRTPRRPSPTAPVGGPRHAAERRMGAGHHGDRDRRTRWTPGR